MSSTRFLPSAFAAGLVLTCSSCVLAPRGTTAERARLAQAGLPYEPSLAARDVPDLPAAPGWRDLLRRAFLVNGDLEAAYFSWKAALARIETAAAWPNDRVTVTFSYLFDDRNLKAWDRSTLAVGPDPMENLLFPTKVMAAGRVALEDAREAGRRFEAAKFDLQRRVLVAWHELALTAEQLRLGREEQAILGAEAAAARARVGAGSAGRELAQASLEVALAANAVASLESTLVRHRAALNGLLGRAPDAPLAPPPALPGPRPLPDDAALLARVAERNADVAAAHAMLASRHEAVGAAWQEFIPDLNPFVGLEGSLAQMAGLAVSLPARVTAILGMIHEREAQRRGAEAALRQREHDQTALFVATLTALRNEERVAGLLAEAVLPAAEQARASARAEYTAGRADWGIVAGAQRAVVATRRELAAARTAREQRLAELEAIAAVDVETLA